MEKIDYTALDIDLNQSGFYNDVIRELSGSIENIIGLSEAEGFISIVGGNIGQSLYTKYVNTLGDKITNVEVVTEVLVDLKRRIGGNFRIESVDEKRIILKNSHCPFAKNVEGRPSLCMMTTNVFGRIVANAQGYARVEVSEAIARGNPGCTVVIYLKPEVNNNSVKGIDQNSVSHEFYRMEE